MQPNQTPAACALLSLLRGEYCDWQIPLDAGSGKTSAHPCYKKVPMSDKTVLNRLQITPNPASNNFEVQLPVYFWQHTGSIQILNLLGRTLQNLPLANGQRSLIVKTAHLPNGLYLCIVQNEAGAIIAQEKLSIVR
ncbi:MAG TPA: T9SS type A sorting domain-containing protein [Chitinophagales bacterium]|nr:T9SS type A sorting domain-containing protein [Chitinophagales bacterium]HRK27914.1 T9SS type A sorting domain-containing protein [Chitinophagales bacterium]